MLNYTVRHSRACRNCLNLFYSDYRHLYCKPCFIKLHAGKVKIYNQAEIDELNKKLLFKKLVK